MRDSCTPALVQLQLQLVQVHLVEPVECILQPAAPLHRHQPDLAPLGEQVADTRVLEHRLRSLLAIKTPTPTVPQHSALQQAAISVHQMTNNNISVIAKGSYAPCRVVD